MKKFNSYLVGYYGMNNSGDDALMQASLWAAKNICKHENIKVSAAKNIKIDEDMSIKANVVLPQRFTGQNRLNHYHAAAVSKSIIFGGGSVLHSAQDINIKRHMMMLSSAKKSIAVGVGIENFKRTADETACKKFLNECGRIRLRDITSYKIAKSIAPDANIELAFDLAPLLLCKENFKISNLKRKGVAINLCPVAKDSFGNTNQVLENKRVAEIVLAIESIWNNTGELITLIDFNGHHHHGDNHIHREVLKKLNPNIAIDYIAYDNNPFRLLQRLASYKVVIGMRLHAAIMSYLADTPVIPLNYHPKCIGWCEQIGISKKYQFDAENFDGHNLAQIVIDNMEQGFEKPFLPIKRAVELSLKNWRD